MTRHRRQARRPAGLPAATERRAGHHRDDLRLVRQPDRAQAQQARRRHRDRQLRHREGEGHLPGRHQHRRAASRPWRPPGTPRRCRRRPRRRGAELRTERARRRTTASDRCASGCVVSAVLTVPVIAMAMVPGAAVHLLAVGLARRWPRRSSCGAPGRSTGPRGPTCATARRRWTRCLDGRARGVRLVALRALPRHGRHAGHDAPLRADHRANRRCRQHLPRGRRRSDHVHARRAVLRGALQAAGRRGAAGPARARRQGRGGAARAALDGRGADPDRAARGRRRGSSYAPARRSRPTASSRTAPPPSTPRC